MNSEPRVYTFHADFSRTFPDPAFPDKRMHRYVFFCKAKYIPEGLPKSPNPRNQNIDRGIYRQIAASLLDDPGKFHLKNKGLTLLAESVRLADKEDKGRYEVVFADGQGIADGAHTYEIIRKNREDCPENQYVRVEILTGIPEEWHTDIVGGLNTAIQVQAMSLANLDKEFEWIKDTLKDQRYSSDIAYRENEDTAFDVRDIVALLTLFNVVLYPVDGDAHPVKAYTSKAAVLDDYLKDMKKAAPSFKKMKNLLPEILDLHDRIHLEAREAHNKVGGRAGKLAFMQGRKRGEFHLVFAGSGTKYRFFDGALYPMLGAFRSLVMIDPQTGLMKWKFDDGYAGVVKLLKEVAASLVASTKDVNERVGHNPNKIGKDRGHWENLFRAVALRDLRRE